MTCFHPVPAFYPLKLDSDGKRRLLFGRKRQLECISNCYTLWMSELTGCSDSFAKFDFDIPYDYPILFNPDFSPKGLNIKVPCGKCIGCRLDYSRMWATRSVHEAFMHDHYQNCSFITLTFNNEMLQNRTVGYSLNKVSFRSWIKRLRKAVYSKYGRTFRFMACGEYGSRHQRPHYHMLIYGFNFPDKKVWKYNKIHGKEVIYYRSDFLEDIWRPAHISDSYGFSVIGDVNFESSAYVARYVTKKLFGAVAEKVYRDREPEFLTTSRMPGLGFDYLNKYYKDMFNHGYVTLPNGFKAPIPRYYSNKLEELDPNLYSKWTITNKDKMIDNLFIENIDSTRERLIVREELKKYNLDILKRQYEFNTSEKAR